MIPSGILRYDVVWGGNGTLSDTVSADGDGVARKVILLERSSQRIIKSTWSAPDGTYSFHFLKTGVDFTVYAFDHTDTYNIAIKDRVRAA